MQRLVACCLVGRASHVCIGTFFNSFLRKLTVVWAGRPSFKSSHLVAVHSGSELRGQAEKAEDYTVGGGRLQQGFFLQITPQTRHFSTSASISY